MLLDSFKTHLNSIQPGFCPQNPRFGEITDIGGICWGSGVCAPSGVQEEGHWSERLLLHKWLTLQFSEILEKYSIWILVQHNYSEFIKHVYDRVFRRVEGIHSCLLR